MSVNMLLFTKKPRPKARQVWQGGSQSNRTGGHWSAGPLCCGTDFL